MVKRKKMQLRQEIIELNQQLRGIILESEEEFKKHLKKYGMQIYNVVPQNFTAVLKLLGLKVSSGIMNKVKERISVTNKNGHRTDIIIEINI